MARETVTIVVDLDDRAGRGLKAIGNQTRKTAGAMDVFKGTIGALGLDALIDVSTRAATALASLAADGIMEAVRANIAFEDTINSAVAVSGGAYGTLADAAREAGRVSAFSATQAGDALRLMGQAGMEAAESVEALPGVLDLAAAGQMGVAEAADIATNALSGFGLGVEELSRVNDVLAQTATSANTNVSQLGQALKNVAPLAASSGQSLESVTAALGILGNAGIQAGEAGTAVRAQLAALQKPSGEAAAVLQELGVQVNDAEGKMRPLVDVVDELGRSGATNSDLITIFGREAVASVTALARSTDDWREATRRANEEAEGTANRLATQQLADLDGQLQLASGSLETLAEQFGSGLNPALTEAARTANVFFQEVEPIATEVRVLTSLFRDNREAISDLTLGGLGAATFAFKATVDSVTGFVEVGLRAHQIVTDLADVFGIASGDADTFEDQVGNAAAAVDWAGKAIFGALTAIIPPLGLLGQAVLEFADLEENAREVARAMDGLDSKRAMERIAEDAERANFSLDSMLDKLASYPGQVVDGVVATAQLRAEEERLAQIRETNSRRALEMDVKAARTSSETAKVRFEREAAVARVRAQGLDSEVERLKIQRTRAQFADRMEAAQKKQAAAAQRAREQAEAEAEAERKARFELIERNALAEYRLEVLQATTEEGRIQAEFALEQQRIEQAELTDLERKVSFLEAEQQYEKDLLALKNEQAEATRMAAEERRREADEARRLSDSMRQVSEALGSISTGIGEVDSISGAFGDLTGAIVDTKEARIADARAAQAVAANVVGAAQQQQAATEQVAEAEMARAAAINATGQAAAGAAGALGASARVEAGIQAAFNAAAAASAIASLYVTGNPAFGIAAGQYAVSAGLFAAVAAGAGGGSSSSVPTGGSAGSGGGPAVAPQSGTSGAGAEDLARIQAEALADVLEERQAGNTVINLNVRTPNDNAMARSIVREIKNDSQLNRTLLQGV